MENKKIISKDKIYFGRFKSSSIPDEANALPDSLSARIYAHLTGAVIKRQRELMVTEIS